MSIWDELDRTTGVFFCRDEEDEEKTVHIWIGDYANLYGDSACYELATPVRVRPDDVRLLALCPTCAENLAGWIAEVRAREAVGSRLGIAAVNVTAAQVADQEQGATIDGMASTLFRDRDRYRWGGESR